MIFKKGDIVLVKEDAYKGTVGRIHNGRMCRVLEVKSGDVVVESIDERQPKLERTFHSPYVLMKVDINEI